jgi:hypothetical protein
MNQISFHKSGPTKAVCGPGGLNCSCCRRGSKREAKRLSARAHRRAARISVHLTVRNGEE